MKKVILAACLTLLLAAAGNANAALVISQIYGGGGATSATTTYDYDYIELFNNSNTAVNLSGYSVQYASSSGTTWATTNLSGSINAYSYFLIRESTASANFINALPTADATGTLNLSATNGKIALVNGTTALSGASPTSFVDLIGYGTANNTTGTLIGALSNTTAGIRDQGGLASTFTIGAPAPLNSLSPANNPTPIPAAAWLLGSGLMGLAGLRKKQN